MELNISCAIKPDHMRSLKNEHISFFKIWNIKNYFCWQAEWQRKKTHQNFFVFNQYSLSFWESFFLALFFTLCYCNRGCPLLNLASMRAWNQHTQSHFVWLWENEVAYPKQISSLWQPEGKDHFTMRVWSSHIIWQWLWILLPSRQSRWSLKTAQPLGWTEVMW